MRRRSQRAAGFTLLEVMIALAIAATGLIYLISQIGSDLARAGDAHDTGVAVDLAHSKMADIEEMLEHEGFKDEEVDEQDGDFEEEGRADFRWQAKIAKLVLPGIGTVQSVDDARDEQADNARDRAREERDDEAEDTSFSATTFEDSPIGQMMAMLGPIGGGSGQLAEGSFAAQNWELFKQVIEASLRKITLTVSWPPYKEFNQIEFVLYKTDVVAMKNVLGGLLGQGNPPPDDNPPPGDNSR